MNFYMNFHLKDHVGVEFTAYEGEMMKEGALTSSQVDGRPPVLTATSQSNGNGQTLTTHRIQTP